MPRDAFGDEFDATAPATQQGGPAAPSSFLPPPGASASPPSSASSWLPGSVDLPDTGSGGPVTSGRPLGPPMYLLVLAGACIVASLILGAVAHGKPALAVAGWVVGGFLSVGFLALFTMRDSLRRASSWYMTRDIAGALRSVLVTAAVVGIALNAFQFADWISRR
jgi:hypothetical protein